MTEQAKRARQAMRDCGFDMKEFHIRTQHGRGGDIGPAVVYLDSREAKEKAMQKSRELADRGLRVEIYPNALNGRGFVWIETGYPGIVTVIL